MVTAAAALVAIVTWLIVHNLDKPPSNTTPPDHKNLAGADGANNAQPAPPLIGHPDTLANGGPGRALLVIPHDYFYEDHYQTVTGALSKRGVTIAVASSQSGFVNPKHNKIKPVRVDLSLDEVDVNDFDAVIFLGGHFWEFTHKGGAPGSRARALIEQFAPARRVIAGVGDGWNAVTDTGLIQTATQRKDRELYIYSRQDMKGQFINIPDPYYAAAFVEVAFDDLLKR